MCKTRFLRNIQAFGIGINSCHLRHAETNIEHDSNWLSFGNSPTSFSASHFVKFYLNGGKYRLFAIFIGRRFGKITSACATDIPESQDPFWSESTAGPRGTLPRYLCSKVTTIAIFVSDIAIFVLKRDVKRQLTN